MKFDYGKIKDPAFFAQNRVKAHSDHHYYKNHRELAEKNESFRQNLNGLWKFQYARNLAEAPADLKQRTLTVRAGKTFVFRHIFRWRATTSLSM